MNNEARKAERRGRIPGANIDNHTPEELERIRGLHTRVMRRRDFVKLGCLAAASAAVFALPGCRSDKGDEVFKGVRTIVDDAGRELSIPAANKLERVYFTSSLAGVFITTLAPDLMGATSGKYTEEDLKYLPKEVQDLKYLGSVETGEMDVEAVLSQDIQLIFSVSSIELVQSNIDEAIDIQELSGIPVVLIDGSFDKIDHAYQMMGEILGREKRAAELAAYCDDAYERVTQAVKDVPEDQRPRVYYAEGPLGLQTEPAQSQHAYSFNVAGGNVVAKVDWFDATGMADVSLESVIAWDPDIIVSWDSELRGGAYELIQSDPSWSVIKAVKTGRVYSVPDTPFAWVDRPMACNRYLGIQWLANMFYPDLFDVDMLEVGKEFYKLFYGCTVSDEEMLGFLGTSYPPYRA